MSKEYTDNKTSQCPECGCPDYLNKNLIGEGYRQCENCGQEWWTDIDYKDDKKGLNNE